MNVILLYFNGQKFYLVLMDANYYVVILFVCLFDGYVMPSRCRVTYIFLFLNFVNIVIIFMSGSILVAFFS